MLIRPRSYRGTKRVVLKWLVSLATVLTTIQALPQLVLLWTTPTVEGVSTTSWLLMLVTSGIWILFAHEFGRKRLLLDASLEAITQVLIVITLLSRQ